jgi:hypothetical protein
MNASLPPRYWRKVVTAACGIALTLAMSGLVPSVVSVVAVAAALGLLVESFGRDVIWLARRRVNRRALWLVTPTTVSARRPVNGSR